MQRMHKGSKRRYNSKLHRLVVAAGAGAMNPKAKVKRRRGKPLSRQAKQQRRLKRLGSQRKKAKRNAQSKRHQEQRAI